MIWGSHLSGSYLDGVVVCSYGSSPVGFNALVTALGDSPVIGTSLPCQPSDPLVELRYMPIPSVSSSSSLKQQAPKEAMGNNMPSRPRFDIWVFFLLAFGVMALAAVAVLTVHELRYDNRVYEGVRVAGIPLGGLTFDEAADAIRDGLTPYPGQTITLRYGDRSWSLSPSDLGVSVDAQALAAEAFAVGRQGALSGTGASVSSHLQGLRDDLASQWHALDAGVSFSPIIRFDANRLTLLLKRIAQEVDLPPREGTLIISGLEVSGSSGQPGRLMDQDQDACCDRAVAGIGHGRHGGCGRRGAAAGSEVRGCCYCRGAGPAQQIFDVGRRWRGWDAAFCNRPGDPEWVAVAHSSAGARRRGESESFTGRGASEGLRAAGGQATQPSGLQCGVGFRSRDGSGRGASAQPDRAKPRRGSQCGSDRGGGFAGSRAAVRRAAQLHHSGPRKSSRCR